MPVLLHPPVIWQRLATPPLEQYALAATFEYAKVYGIHHKIQMTLHMVSYNANTNSYVYSLMRLTHYHSKNNRFPSAHSTSMLLNVEVGGFVTSSKRIFDV